MGIVLALVEQFSGGGGVSSPQGAGLRWRHAKASWAYLFRMIRSLSSSSSRVKFQTPRESGFAGALTAQHRQALGTFFG